MPDRFLREPEVRRVSGLSRTTRWRLERAGVFPKRRQISPNAVAWLESEIQAWLQCRAEQGVGAVEHRTSTSGAGAAV